MGQDSSIGSCHIIWFLFVFLYCALHYFESEFWSFEESVEYFLVFSVHLIQRVLTYLSKWIKNYTWIRGPWATSLTWKKHFKLINTFCAKLWNITLIKRRKKQFFFLKIELSLLVETYVPFHPKRGSRWQCEKFTDRRIDRRTTAPGDQKCSLELSAQVS